MTPNGTKRHQSQVDMARLAIRLSGVAAAMAAIGWAIALCARPGLIALRGLVGGPRAVRGSSADAAAAWALDDIVGAGLALVAVAAYVALVGTAAIAVVAEASGSRHAARLAARGWAGPVWWRAAVLAACGLGVAVQTAAAGAAIDHRAPCAATCAPSLDGLPYPDLPSREPPVDRSAHGSRPAPRAAASATSTASTVVVRRGDSLWSIAEGLMPPSTGNARVAVTVHRLYALNRDVIGADPDLIYVRTELQTPEGNP
jgi:hypothetical protein